MGRRRKAPSNDERDGRVMGPMVKKAKAAVNRNRASSFGLVKLYPHLTDKQKSMIRDDLKQGTLLDIKCDQLSNALLAWLTKLYCPKDKALIIPGRGSIPLNEQVVYETTGLPRGTLTVPYYVDYVIEDGLVKELFPNDSNRPKLTRVAELLTGYKEADAKFKKLWMVYVTCGFLAPTTGTRISNKVYPMLVNVAGFGEYNLCKFVADYMHESLSSGKFNNACLLCILLKYISSLNCDDYVVDLGESEFGINLWTRQAVEAIAALDTQDDDPNSFGKLQLKEEFAAKLELFGGPSGFEKWMSHNTHHSCSAEEKKRIGSLLFDHAVGLNGLLSKLAQGWTALGPAASACMEDSFNLLSVPRARPPPRACEQQGKDDSLAEESSSDSESSNERTDRTETVRTSSIQNTIRTPHITRSSGRQPSGASPRRSPRLNPASLRRSPRLNPASGEMSIGASTRLTPRPARYSREKSAGASPSQCNSTKHTENAVSFDTSNMNLGEGVHQIDMDRGSNDGGIQSAENIIPSLLWTVPTEQIHQNTEFATMLTDNTGSQTIPLMDSDASLSETATGGDDTVITESQTSSQHVDNMIRSEAASMAMRLSGLKGCRATAEKAKGHVHDEQIHSEVKSMVACKLGLLKDTPSTPPSGLTRTVGDRSRTPKGTRVKRVYPRGSPQVNAEGPLHKQAKISDAVIDGGQDQANRLNNVEEALTEGQGNPASADSPIGGGKANDIAGLSYSSAILLSPTADITGKGGEGRARETGKSASTAIIISPTVRAESILVSSALRENVLASLHRTPSPHGPLPRSNLARNADGSPFVVSSELRRIVSELSAAVKAKEKGKAVVSDSAASGSKKKKKRKPRDPRPGMFTPPSFHLLSQSSPSSSEYDDMNVDSSPDRDGFVCGISAPVNAPPLAFARFEDPVDKLRKEEKLGAYLDGTIETVDDEVGEMLDKLENDAREDIKRMRESAAANGGDAEEVGVLSVTPKPFARRTRVTKASRFKSSPYDEFFSVSEDEDDVYKKLMMSTTNSRASNIKKLDIVKYPQSWIHTVELADSMKPRAQLSTRVCDVAIEYIRNNCRVEKRVVFPYLVVDRLLANEFAKRIVTKAFRKQKDYSLTVQNQVLFAVMENFGTKPDDPHHWYVVGINMLAKRFEVLDSLRGPNSPSLIQHSDRVINKLKEAWDVFYENAKNKIEAFETRIIEVPLQETPNDCGFYMLNNLERWFGQEIPDMQPHHVEYAKKKWPLRLLSSQLNKTRKWRFHLDNNKL